ncbi:hypothetical protein J1N35_011580 [Gossypium stocksii]|uniref:RNase H type-1 domain-containing protein n=1 Tax=Gossypium stocksii TaxID=47602 RepID=A0A9D3W335_9ROSI|nr:hypothetical protein J1N35_011580 [Gossypium stocksii]
MGVKEALNPEKYLGMPMMVGRKKNWALAKFVDCFKKGMNSWSVRYLSMGGKEVFIKSVLQVILMYVMQCFALPKELYHKLEGIMNKLWWSNSKSAKAKVGSYPLFTWRSVCGARDLIAGGIIWRIGNGTSVNIWNDLWIPGKNDNKLVFTDFIPHLSSVNQLIDSSTNTKNKELISSFVDEDQRKRILAIPINHHKLADTVAWKYEATGEFSVRSGYWVLITEINQMKNYNSYNSEIYMDFYKALCDNYNKQVLAISLWALWNRRNKWVHEGEICFCYERLKIPPQNITEKFWRPPEYGAIKLNFDASFQSDPKTSMVAAIAINYKCEVVGAITYAVDDVVDALVAEARACERAILFVVDMGFHQMILEGDSLAVIRRIKSSVEDKSISDLSFTTFALWKSVLLVFHICLFLGSLMQWLIHLLWKVGDNKLQGSGLNRFRFQ